jgi:hypothetical protein
VSTPMACLSMTSAGVCLACDLVFLVTRKVKHGDVFVYFSQEFVQLMHTAARSGPGCLADVDLNSEHRLVTVNLQ